MSIKREILSLVSDLSKLNKITVPRCLSFSTNDITTLHTFLEAFEKAYSAVTYVRHKSPSKQDITVVFVCRKTKNCAPPPHQQAYPELMAAVLGLRLSLVVGSTLDLRENKMKFWSDSANVLYWITGQSRRYTPFVANRIVEIHENSLPSNWHDVPSEENPADVAFRGIPADKLLESTLWCKCQDFLYDELETWPKKIQNNEQRYS